MHTVTEYSAAVTRSPHAHIPAAASVINDVRIRIALHLRRCWRNAGAKTATAVINCSRAAGGTHRSHWFIKGLERRGPGGAGAVDRKSIRRAPAHRSPVHA